MSVWATDSLYGPQSVCGGYRTWLESVQLGGMNIAVLIDLVLALLFCASGRADV